MTTPLSATRDIADHIKEWAGLLINAAAMQTASNTQQPRELYRIAAQMNAFSNNLIAEVERFEPTLNKLETNSQYGKMDAVSKYPAELMECPTCGSPDPAAKPAVDTGTKIEFVCDDVWHTPTVRLILAKLWDLDDEYIHGVPEDS